MPETIVDLTPDDTELRPCCSATPATSTSADRSRLPRRRRDSPPRASASRRPAIADAFYREHGIALGGVMFP
jgi:hypothetical protein